MLKEYFGVSEAFQEIDRWYSTQGTDVICTEASETKTICFMNYTAAPALQDSCENVGAVFIETTSIFQCTMNDGKTLFYTSETKPNCYDASCQAAEITALENEASNLLIDNLIAGTVVSCTRVRLEISEPMYPSDSGNAEPPNCQDDTNATMSKLNDTEAVTEKVVDAMKSACTVKENSNDSVWGNARFQNCEANFRQMSHSISEGCQSVDGLYVELDYSMSCQHPSEDPMTMSVVADPLCSSKTFCTLAQLDQLATNYTYRLFFTSAPSEWNCTLLNIQIIDYLASASPTTSPAPTVTPAPTSAPTVTPVPTISPAPTLEANDGNCLKNSALLNATTSVQESLLGLSTSVDVCQLNSTNVVNSTTNIRSLQSDQPCEVVEYVHSNDMVLNLQSICGEIDGLYAEEIFTIQCVSSDDGTVTEKRIHNKPACRYRKCNGEEMKDVLLEEWEWMRSSMEVDGVVACDIQNVQILARVGNIDGFLPDGSLPKEFQVSEACHQESDHLDTIIAIYNERQRIVQNFEAYTQVDMRQICTSMSPGLLHCYFDWENFAETNSPDNLETLCNKNGGQYLTGKFVTVCSKAADDQIMNLFSINVPECLGLSCSPGQAELYLMDADDSWITNQFKNEGWECKISSTSVFAPNYLTADERANLTASPTQAPDPTGVPTTASPVSSPSIQEPDESDPLNRPTATTVPSPTDREDISATSKDQDDSEGLSIGAISGIAIGAFVGLCLCCIAMARRRGGDRSFVASKTKKRVAYDGVDFDDEVGARENSGVYDWDTYDDEAGDPRGGDFNEREGYEDDTDPSDRTGNEDEEDTRSDSDELDDDEEWDDDPDESSDEEGEGSSDEESVEYK